jgi:hypothetical protein
VHGMAPEAALLRVKDALARGPQALANLAAQPGATAGRPEAAGSRGGNSRTAGPPPSVPAPRRVNPPAVPPSGRGVGRGGH